MTRSVRGAKQTQVEDLGEEEIVQISWLSLFSPPRDRLEPILQQELLMDTLESFQVEEKETFFLVQCLLKRKVLSKEEAQLEKFLRGSSTLQSFDRDDWDCVSIPFHLMKTSFYLAPSQTPEWAEGAIRRWGERNKIKGLHVMHQTLGERTLVQVLFFTH